MPASAVRRVAVTSTPGMVAASSSNATADCSSATRSVAAVVMLTTLKIWASCSRAEGIAASGSTRIGSSVATSVSSKPGVLVAPRRVEMAPSSTPMTSRTSSWR
jgi:hypothetical protein